MALVAAPSFASDSVTVNAEPSLAIAATHVIVDGGQVIENAIVLVGEGRILAVGAKADLIGNLPAGVPVIDHAGWLSTGLIAVNSNMALTYNDDTTNAFMDNLELASGFDPESKRLDAARDLGVTSLGLVAGTRNVIGGVGAIAKTDGTLVKRRSSLSINLSSSSFVSGRFPTSFGGSLGALRSRVNEPEGSMADAIAGDLTTSIAVGTRAEIARAIAFASASNLQATLRGAARAGEFTSELKAANMSVALNPLRPGSSPQTRASILSLAKAGVPFAFGLADDYGSGANLRESAALAVRAGLDRGTAWRSITSSAASMMGAGKQLGRVASGYDADLVLWSGDPLLLSSRPIAVYLDGKLTEGGQR